MTSFAKNYKAADLTFDADVIYWVNPEDNETSFKFWQTKCKFCPKSNL